MHASLLGRVPRLVALQMGLLEEGLAASRPVAFVWPDTGVRSAKGKIKAFCLRAAAFQFNANMTSIRK